MRIGTKVLGLLFWLLLAGAVGWAQQEPAAPRLLVKPLEPQPIGARIDIETTLVGNEDRPLANNVLELYVDGEYLRRIRTDEVGTATIRVSRPLSLGDHQATVQFIGTKDYLEATATVAITVRPLLLTVETVPPLAGVPFVVNGQSVESDALGIVQVEVVEPATFDLEVVLEPGTLLTPDTRVSFSRWNDAVFTPDRQVEVLNKDVMLQVGLELSHPVTTRFLDLGGYPIDWSRVSALTLKSSSAAYRTITEDQQPYWLQANRIMRQRSGIFPTPLQWSVESVILDGANVVNRYQQRFFVEPDNTTWEVGLLLYQAHIRSKDALFGFPVGTGVSLTYPDGTLEQHEFDGDYNIYMENLARGLYKLQVTGVQGVAPVTPVAMTRDQQVELKVFSGVDIGAVVALGLILAFGLLFYGRPHLIGLGARARRGRAGPPPLPEHASGASDPALTPGMLEPDLQPLASSEPTVDAVAPETIRAAVLEYLTGEASVSELAGRYRVAPSWIHRWVAEYLEVTDPNHRSRADFKRGVKPKN